MKFSTISILKEEIDKQKFEKKNHKKLQKQKEKGKKAKHYGLLLSFTMNVCEWTMISSHLLIFITL